MAKQTRKTQAQKSENHDAKLERELRIVRKRFYKAFAAVEAARQAVWTLAEDAFEMGFTDLSGQHGSLVDLQDSLRNELEDIEITARRARKAS